MKEAPYLPHIQGSGGEIRMPELSPRHKSVYAKYNARKMRDTATAKRCAEKKKTL